MNELSRRELLKSGALLAPALLGLASFSAPAAEPYEDAVLLDGEPPKLEPGAYTIAVLPDTQHYSEEYPDTYLAQTKWIVKNKTKRNIACVLHLGDITNRNTVPEWVAAQKAMQKLDGHVPYFMVPGNHDYSYKGVCKDRTTLMNEYFPVCSFKDRPTFGGVYDKEPDRIENSFHTFAAGGRKFLVIGLEFGPRRDVVLWAKQVAVRHPDHSAILITHAYMYYDDARYDWKKLGKKQTWNPHDYAVARATDDDVMDGEELWTELVGKNKNFIMTINGHVLKDGLGRLSSKSPSGGHDVHQMLVNFQMRPNGGDGWLRLLEFREDKKMVQVYDYSPTRKQRNESKQNQFTLALA